jgi:hypothetical protein
MKKLNKQMLSLLLVATIIFSVIMCMFTGCNNQDYYSFSIALDWQENGKYSTTVSLDDVDATFNDITADDFRFKAQSSSTDDEATADEATSDESADAELKDFSLTKTDDKTLTVEFALQNPNELKYDYSLVSSSAVTSDNKYLQVSFTIELPDLSLTSSTKGAYLGSENLTVNLEFSKDGRFVDELSSSMFELPSGWEGDVTVTRISDTQAALSIDNVPNDITSSFICLTMSKDAIDSPFANDVAVSIDFPAPSLTSADDSISLDLDNNKVTFSKLCLPDKITGQSDGLSVLDQNFAIESQDYNEDENYYSVTLTSKKTLDEEVLDSLKMSAVLNIGDEQITYNFTPYLPKTALVGEVENDEDSNTTTITLTVNNGSFAKDIAEKDFAISGNDNFKNLKFVSADSESAVFTASYEENDYYNDFIRFELDGKKIEGNFYDDSYSATVFVSVYPEDRQVDHTETVTKLVSGAAYEFGGMIAGSAVEALMPYIYELFGINTDQPSETDQINKSLSNISNALSDLSHDVSNLTSAIQDSNYKSQLTDFQSYEMNILYDGTILLEKPDVIEYAGTLDSSYFTKEKNKTKTSSSDNKITAAFIKAFESLNGYSDYIKNVLNYGDKILKTAEGLDVGALEQFFTVINNKYNFESQTTDGKKAFLTRVTTIYYSNASIAYQYCKAKGSSNAATIQNQITSVSKIVSKLWETLLPDDARAEKGNDLLLVTGQEVSKEMSYIDVTSNIFYAKRSECLTNKSFYPDSVTLTTDSIRDMASRALARNKSLQEDLKAAGFSNIKANKDSNYVYYAGDFRAAHKNFTEFPAALFKYTLDFQYEFYANIVVQDGSKEAEAKQNEYVGGFYSYYCSIKSPKDKEVWKHNYDYMAYFVQPNK